MSKVDRDKNTLSVQQLFDQLNAQIEAGNGEWKVRLHVEKLRVTMGASPSVDVIGVEEGFDWNHKTLFLGTSEPLGVANAKFQAMKKKMMQTQETMYWVDSILRNEKLSPEQKILNIQSRLDQYKAKIGEGKS